MGLKTPLKALMGEFGTQFRTLDKIMMIAPFSIVAPLHALVLKTLHKV